MSRFYIFCFQPGQSRAPYLAQSVFAAVASIFPPRPCFSFPPPRPGETSTSDLIKSQWCCESLCCLAPAHYNRVKQPNTTKDDDTSFLNITSLWHQERDLHWHVPQPTKVFLCKICFCPIGVRCALAVKDPRNRIHSGI